VLIRKENQNCLEELIVNGMSSDLEHFLEIFNIGPKDPLSEERISIWHDVQITWSIGPQMTRDNIRRSVGNAAGIIIFDESAPESQFDPSLLYLGQMSHSICVIKPININEKQFYKMGSFLNYQTKFTKDFNFSEEDALQSVAKMKEINFGLELPLHYLFTDKTILNFVLLKIHVMVANAKIHHDAIRRQFQIPFADLFQEMVISNHPEWHQKMVKLYEEKNLTSDEILPNKK